MRCLGSTLVANPGPTKLLPFEFFVFMSFRSPYKFPVLTAKARHQTHSKLVNTSPAQFSQTNHMRKAEDSSLMKLWLKIGKLQKGLSLLIAKGPPDHRCSGCDEILKVAALVPEDVKDGHFAVFAVVGKETTRFVTKLASLNDPAFMNLLEQAKDEYGFQQKGALEVHCSPEELHSILENCRMQTK